MIKYLSLLACRFSLIIFVCMLSGNTEEQNQKLIYKTFSNPFELQSFIDSQLVIFNKATEKIRLLEKNPPKKDEFETTDNYKARVEKEKQPFIKIIREVMDSNKKYLATDLFPVELGPYKAERQVFSHLSYKSHEEPISYWTGEISYPITKARELREKSDYLRFEAIFSMLFWITDDSNWFTGTSYSKYNWYVEIYKVKFYREDTGEIIFEKTLNVKK